MSTTVGYQGGTSSNPTYGDVCSGKTGHAEVVEVKYDPAQVSLEHLLSTWLSMHDPTMDATKYRGGQYRSLVYYTTPEQEQVIKKVLTSIAARVHRPITSEVGSAPKFWRAEDYHQQYYDKHKAGACSL